MAAISKLSELVLLSEPVVSLQLLVELPAANDLVVMAELFITIKYIRS